MQAPIDGEDFVDEGAEIDTDPTRDQLEAHLRDSIVGRYIRSYNKRLRTLNHELEELRRLLEDRFAGVDRRVTQEVTEIKTGIRSLAPKDTADDLGLTLEKIEGLIDAKLDARLDGMTARGEADLQKLSTFINEFANDFQEQIDRLSNEVRLLREQGRRNQEALRTELTAETETLETSKVDRLTFAETLIMLGMKLKDEDLLNEFGIDLDFEESLDKNGETADDTH